MGHWRDVSNEDDIKLIDNYKVSTLASCASADDIAQNYL